jgi:hypothetical protein
MNKWVEWIAFIVLFALGLAAGRYALACPCNTLTACQNNTPCSGVVSGCNLNRGTGTFCVYTGNENDSCCKSCNPPIISLCFGTANQMPCNAFVNNCQ